MKPDTENKNNYIPGIDGLRAVAVLAVMLYHLDPAFLPGGFSGVDVFFVISGYVVSRSLSREAAPNFIHFTLKFYARRIIRIFPALIAFLIAASIITTLVVPSSWLSDTNQMTALAAFLGASNIALILYSDGYFSPRAEFNPFVHTWSLGVEEQFYLVFPFIFFIWLKYRERKNSSGFFANWSLEGLLALSLVYSYFETSSSPDRAFYLLPGRFWELACGALLFKLHQQKMLVLKSKSAIDTFFWTGIALISLAFTLSDQSSFPFPWAMLPVGGTMFLIAAAVNKTESGSMMQNFIENPAMVYIGKISYSLYLWHWPVFALFRWTTGLESPLQIVSAVSFIAILSIISYHCLEIPVRNNFFVLKMPPWKIITGGIAIIFITFLLSIKVFQSQPSLSLSVTKDTQAWYPYPWPSKANTASPKSLSGHKLFVMGDSHASAYDTMFKKLIDEYGVDVRQYAKGGCPAADLIRPAQVDCAQNIEKTVAEIQRLARPGDIVFLASLRVNRLAEQTKIFDEAEITRQRIVNSSAKREIALQEASKLLRKLKNSSLHILIDAPKPIFKSPPFRCSDWFNSNNPVCSSGFALNRDFLIKHRSLAMESLDRLIREHPKLIVWDPFPILCPTDACSAFDKDGPLFFDGDHLTAHGNRVLYPDFLSLLKTIWQSNPN